MRAPEQRGSRCARRALLGAGLVALLPACLPVREGPSGLIGSEPLQVAGEARMTVLHDRRVVVTDGGSLIILDMEMDDRGPSLTVVDLDVRTGATVPPQLTASQQGHLVAVAAGDLFVHLVTPYMERVVGRLPVRRRAPLKAPITALALDAAGERLLTGHEDGALSLWEVGGGLVAAIASGQLPGPVRAVSFAQATGVLAVGGNGEVVRWSPGHPRLTPVLEPADEVADVALRGDTLARVVGETVEVRSCAGGEAWSFSPHLPPPLRVGVGPGGRRVVVAGLAPPDAKAPVQVWRRGDLEPEHSFDGHRQGVRAVAFGANGHRVISLGLDGRVRAWDLDY